MPELMDQKNTEQKADEPKVIDYSNKDDLISTWPLHVQETIRLARAKNVSRTVDVDPFHLRRPLSTDYLLRDTRLLLEPNKKHCLIGEPSCGKSTLFEEIANGKILEWPKHIHVHHCKEIEVEAHAESVLDTVVHAHKFRSILLDNEAKIKAAIENNPTPETLALLKANLEFVNMYLVKVNASTAYDRASKMLRVLGFDDKGQAKSVNDLSGGLRMRVALCCAFFVEADILLLDEPTNHLDFPSVLWLENRLRGYRQSFVLVSHDRDLLQNVCTSVIHFHEKQLKIHNKGFAAFEKDVAVAEKKKAAEVDKFLKMHQNLDFSHPLAREKQEKKNWSEAYYNKQIQLAGKFTFPDSEPLERSPVDPVDVKHEDISLIKVDNVRFTYNNNVPEPIWIFDTPINLNVTASTRMGVMGPNGAGKSTLLKLITDKLTATAGTVSRHPTAKVAYFAQHHVMDLNLEQTAIEYMVEQFPMVSKAGLLRSHLSKVGITGDKAETRMKNLSAGQKSCVVFAKITYFCPHLLIMDEPTNFLDLESVDSLIAATNKYKGALLLVSHNRGFLIKCAKQFLSVVPGKFMLFNDLKVCERATYEFIQEMESGVKVGASALSQAKQHGTAGALVAGSAPAATQAGAGVVLPSASATPSPAAATPAGASPAKAPEENKVLDEASLVGYKCTAVWATDGKRYPAVIMRSYGGGEVEVTYLGYNEKARVKLANVVLGEKPAPIADKKPQQNGKGGGKVQPQQNGGKAKAGGQGAQGGRKH